MKSIGVFNIIENKKIYDNIYDITIKAKDIANECKAGQFLNIYLDNGKHILPRPISICEIDKNNGTIRMIYQVIGDGTEILSKLNKKYDTIKVLGPLGNGYNIMDKNKNILIGGGMGIPPLLELAKNIKGDKSVFIGAKKNPLLVDEFKKTGANVYVATDDGSSGFKGNIMELLKHINPDAEAIYSCGPKIMLKSVSNWAKKLDIKAQISMEERMACGIGACLGCAIKIKESNGSSWSNLKVCTNGPVFLSDEVIW